LCLPHHSKADDRTTGEANYPPELLRKWKAGHEGINGPALAALGPIDEESLASLLLEAFDPPVKRLEKIADQLETMLPHSVAALDTTFHQLIRALDVILAAANDMPRYGPM
jgi:hypothetical protein